MSDQPGTSSQKAVVRYGSGEEDMYISSEEERLEAEEERERQRKADEMMKKQMEKVMKQSQQPNEPQPKKKPTKKRERKYEEVEDDEFYDEDDDEDDDGDEDEEFDEDQEYALYPSGHGKVKKVSKLCRVKKMPGGLKIDSQEVIQRAVEFMQLYALRWADRKIPRDLFRQMLFYGRIFGAPTDRIQTPPHISYKYRYYYDQYIPLALWHCPTNFAHFFHQMDQLESRVGHRQWDFFYISGAHFIGIKEYYQEKKKLGRHQKHHIPMTVEDEQQEHSRKWQQKFFRAKMINIVRTLHKAAMERDWAMAAECIAKIPICRANQKHASVYFEYMSHSLAPYLPSIHSMAMQCVLETRQPIGQLGQQFGNIFHAFIKTRSDLHPWRDNTMLYYSHLLMFHLVNLRLLLQQGEEDQLRLAAQAVQPHGGAERRRVIMLLNYCIDMERHLLELERDGYEASTAMKKGYIAGIKIQDQSLINMFPHFLETLFQEPRDCIGLLPMAVWSAVQFDYMEDLTEKLLEECTNYPYLLIPVYNVLARFQLENVVGQILSQIFDLALQILPTTTFMLDLVEQRTLDPSSHGQLDGVISGNLKALFQFLDYGRNRAEERAWGLLYSNLAYIKDSAQMARALVRPQWEKRKSWWPQFHDAQRVGKIHKTGTKMRRKVFQLLKEI